jgi:hypothetical protein
VVLDMVLRESKRDEGQMQRRGHCQQSPGWVNAISRSESSCGINKLFTIQDVVFLGM